MPPPAGLDNVDNVLAIARQAGISANKLEVRPAKNAHNAWTVTEIERRWPTQADMVAINLDSGVVVDYVRFADYPFAAKLTRWGIDAHMGVLFGLPNQLILAGFGLGLCALIAWGYRLWWLRRQRPAGQPHPANTLFCRLNCVAARRASTCRLHRAVTRWVFARHGGQPANILADRHRAMAALSSNTKHRRAATRTAVIVRGGSSPALPLVQSR
ncbi:MULTISPECIES: PepSY-associated TM helix domain-containing protein [Symbiopectobacterium]|uniref:PepSY-associated TM helix domain-containing protein n=1 Tax=Symbiopectobacterium TaxID=801 RepID=UPI0027DF97F4|nr:PepSY-associated TM helix domain-containing protein [Candidatus Symbiopectobacterium endolongispinus]